MHGSSIPKTFPPLEKCLKISSFVACALLLALGLAARAEEEPPRPAQDPVAMKISRMSTEEKIGQLMIWTFAGTEFGPQHRELLSKYPLGALIVFSRNIKSLPQTAKFNADAQAFAARKLKAPLFLMVDQEGGAVTRVKVSTPIPSALALGQAEDPAFIEDYAKTKGELLAALGFNFNLAPVVDVTDPASDSFIANRAFSNDPRQVAKIAIAYSRGLSAAGIIPTAKHFPGHGGMVNDSHKSVPQKLATLAELDKRDLIPFVEFIGGDFPKAMMMAHLSLPNVDPSGVPATFSPLIIEDNLRARLHYDGLLLTDDLEMGGATAVSEDIGERGVRAFLAGNDMLMFAGPPAHQRRAFEAMLAAVKTGRITSDRLDQSVRRILVLKSPPRKDASPFLPNTARVREYKAKLEALSREVMKKNFRHALGKKSAQWPKVDAGTRVAVFANDPRFYRGFKSRFGGKAEFTQLTPDTLKKVTAIVSREETAAAVFYASGKVTSDYLNRMPLELRAKTIVINCVNPGRIEDAENFLSVLNLGSHSPESGEWLAEALNTAPDLRVPASQTASEEKEEPPGG